MKISMFSTHEMKYIWYLLKKRVNFLFILYFLRRFTVNQFVNHASSRKEDKGVFVTEHLDQSTCTIAIRTDLVSVKVRDK